MDAAGFWVNGVGGAALVCGRPERTFRTSVGRNAAFSRARDGSRKTCHDSAGDLPATFY
jgi:hypothetical protein